ncbi:MAG TPA: alpha/beta family hydrolase [Blastocatellia bacterium]|nr:alpha/beta family hydrolase [Blastocatellia bacterium]
MERNTGVQIHDNEKLVEVPAGNAKLEGILGLPENATGIVLFAHGSGSGRLSPRNNYVARVLREAGIGTLLMDLIMVEEAEDRDHAFDIDLLTQRILITTEWLEESSDTKHLRVGYFGASAGAAVALKAAARAGLEDGLPITGEPGPCAVVCRGGRADLVADDLKNIKAPTLLIVGGNDEPVIAINEDAYARLQCEKRLVVVPGATHLFEEPGALDEVAQLTADWFRQHLIANLCL